jgi:flavin-dependent thymidylate synthase
MKNTVKLEGYYGGDFTHAQFAWTSTGGETEKKRERIPELLNMLAKNEHGTPFEASLLHFSATVDTATHIHLLKHRHFSINGESARYREYTEDKKYVPVDWSGLAKFAIGDMTDTAYNNYHLAIKRLEEDGLSRKRAKESARYFLPYAIQINLSFACNFRAFIHFQHLRNSENAQLEIREIAAEMLRLVQEETNNDFKHSLSAHGLGAVLAEHSQGCIPSVYVP